MTGDGIKTYIINTRQYTSDRDVVKIVCRRSIGFYREITQSVMFKGYLAIWATPQDNGRFKEDEDADDPCSDYQ